MQRMGIYEGEGTKGGKKKEYKTERKTDIQKGRHIGFWGRNVIPAGGQGQTQGAKISGSHVSSRGGERGRGAECRALTTFIAEERGKQTNHKRKRGREKRQVTGGEKGEEELVDADPVRNPNCQTLKSVGVTSGKMEVLKVRKKREGRLKKPT